MESFDHCLISAVFNFPYSHNRFEKDATPFSRKKFENGVVFGHVQLISYDSFLCQMFHHYIA